MILDDLQWRRLAVAASGLIYWVGVWLQARRVRKRIGRTPNLKPRGAKETALWFGWFLVILVWIGQPGWIRAAGHPIGLALFPRLVHPAVGVVGLVLIALGYAGTLWTYAAMGDAWRIGINRSERTPLVRAGPYRWVRHPIYGFQVVMLAGAALLLPTPVSFATLVFHLGCVLMKARDEEAYLVGVHGGKYREYQAGTGALFPRWFGCGARPRGSVPPGIDS